MVFKIVALVLPLGLDTFAISAALAVGGISSARRLRTSLLFAGFEAGMPLVGLAIGRPLGSTIGSAADYVAIGVLLIVGVVMLRENDEDGQDAEANRLSSMFDRGGMAAIAVGISISLDELAIGFTFGLLRLPVVPVIVVIAAQAFLVAQLGMRIGERVGERIREGAEHAAGAALALLAVGLLIAKLAE